MTLDPIHKMILVQIGTNTGNDHVLQLCKQVAFDRIFLVEPFTIHNTSIHSLYRDIPNYTLDNLAIVPRSMPSVELYYTDSDGPSPQYPQRSYEVASIRPEHLVKHNYMRAMLKSVTVPACTLNEYFAKYNLNRIDYLFLDIEGIDFEVVETIEFGRFDIRRVQIEHLHLDKRRLFDFMRSKGYSPEKGMDLCGYDTMFVKIGQ